MDSISYRLNVSHVNKQNLNTYRRIVREFLYVFRLCVGVYVSLFVNLPHSVMWCDKARFVKSTDNIGLK